MTESTIKTQIQQKLLEIEKEHDVKILFAIESGSRAWGFPSPDSDWDVRFVYIHRPEWYLSVNKKRDVIELTIDEDLDINGWDLRKALYLIGNSNPGIVEWTHSPIIYTETDGVISELRELINKTYCHVRGMLHYGNMARNNNREFLQGPHVHLKKYLYVLRAQLAYLYIQKYQTPAPIEFRALMKMVSDRVELTNDINDLLELKHKTNELGFGPQIKSIHDFIKETLSAFEEASHSFKLDEESGLEFDQFFLKTLTTVWGNNLNSNPNQTVYRTTATVDKTGCLHPSFYLNGTEGHPTSGFLKYFNSEVGNTFDVTLTKIKDE